MLGMVDQLLYGLSTGSRVLGVCQVDDRQTHLLVQKSLQLWTTVGIETNITELAQGMLLDLQLGIGGFHGTGLQEQFQSLDHTVVHDGVQVSLLDGFQLTLHFLNLVSIQRHTCELYLDDELQAR